MSTFEEYGSIRIKTFFIFLIQSFFGSNGIQAQTEDGRRIQSDKGRPERTSGILPKLDKISPKW